MGSIKANGDRGALQDREDRMHGHQKRPTDERTEPERDRDRILFSSAFRRLAGVTQVVAPTELHPIHNRLTHSLKVAQIGRGIAVRLQNQVRPDALEAAGGLDPTVVDAAGLAHDLGHPPFGHVAEYELNILLTHGGSVTIDGDGETKATQKELPGVSDGFEGNAQSFRIVTKLSARFEKDEGLDLTRATLGALQKYPWTRRSQEVEANEKKRKKWGAYDSERDDLEWARELARGQGDARSLEAGLMDWADDVAYAVHDLEDFYRAGIIPLHQLAAQGLEQEFLTTEAPRQSKELGRGVTEQDVSNAFRQAMKSSQFTLPYEGTRSERVHLRELTSRLINRYMSALSFREGAWGEGALEIEPSKRQEVETLKSLTFFYVIDSQALASQRYGQRRVIRTLFEIFANAAYARKKTERRIFPPFFQERLDRSTTDDMRLRVVSDLIASMSEAQAIETHDRLTGVSLGSALERPPL